MVASASQRASFALFWRPETLSLIGLVAGLLGIVISKLCFSTRYLSEAQTSEIREQRLKHFQPKAKARRRRHASPTQVNRDDNFLNPSRYQPAEEAAAVKALRASDEAIEVRDGAGGYQPASCLLDTGNQHMTVVDERCAKRLGLLAASGERSTFARPEGYTTLRGVNPGAETRVPVVTATLRLRGREFRTQVAVSSLPGQDVLVGVDILRQLYAEGFYIVGC